MQLNTKVEQEAFGSLSCHYCVWHKKGSIITWGTININIWATICLALFLGGNYSYECTWETAGTVLGDAA